MERLAASRSHRGKPRLRLIVLTMNRSSSLQRLLDSLLSAGTSFLSLSSVFIQLNHADYAGDRADLDLWIDAVGAKVNRSVVDVAKQLSWPFGKLTVHIRNKNAGLRAQWLESWARSTRLGWRTREIPLILEDDVEVSRHFWRWLKAAHAAYGKRPDVAGFSLQRAALCAAESCGIGGLDWIRKTPGPFMYMLVGSWGFSPTLRHWRRFTRWAAAFEGSGEKPYVAGLVTTRWYKSFEGDGRCPGKNCMWTALHVKYATLHRDRYTVYVQSGRKRAALAVNHQERGVHYDRPRGQDARLVRTWEPSLEHFPERVRRVGWDGMELEEPAFVRVARELSAAWGTVVVHLFDSHFVEMTAHWICNVRQLEGDVLRRTLFIAVDESAELELKRFVDGIGEKANVVLEMEKESAAVKDEKLYGQVGYYMMMLRRTEMLLLLLFAGVDILLAEADAVWLRNPIPEITKLSRNSDVTLMDDDPPQQSPQGGFMMVKANAATRDAFHEVLLRQEDRMMPHEGRNDTDEIGEDGNEQYIEASVMKRRERRGKLSVEWLPSNTFVSGVYYSNPALRERQDYTVVLFNWIIGTAAKIARAKEHGHWFLHENKQVCA